MAIEFDIEDILGAGCLSSIGRALSAISCLWLGAATGNLGFHTGLALVELLDGARVDLADLGESVLMAALFGPLVMFGSLLIPFFFPLVLMVYFAFARGDGGTVKGWVIYAAVTGLLALLSLRGWADADLLVTGLGAIMWLGFAGSLGMLAFALAGWQRRRLAEHLMAVAAANEERRRESAEEFGTAVGDREFASGDRPFHSPPPPPRAAPGPRPPVPKRPRDDHRS